MHLYTYILATLSWGMPHEQRVFIRAARYNQALLPGTSVLIGDRLCHVARVLLREAVGTTAAGPCAIALVSTRSPEDVYSQDDGEIGGVEIFTEKAEKLKELGFTELPDLPSLRERWPILFESR